MLSATGDLERSPRIVLRDVSKAFVSPSETVWASRNVDLEAHAGEFVCLHGASGSGKTTLLRLIAGLEPVPAGLILVDGVRVDELDEAGGARLRLRHVGVVHQRDGLIGELTALENVTLPLEASGVSTREASIEAFKHLDLVGMGSLGGRFPHQLSGGQRQRVGIARALVGRRKVLLADEPTGALDSEASEQLFELIQQLCREGITALVSSHDPRCRQYADTTYEMIDGRVARGDRQ